MSAAAGKSKPKRGLGRGLDALLGDTASGGGSPSGSGASRLPIASIEPGRFQPRRLFDKEELKALAASIKDKGILQPVLVRPMPGARDRYELIAGERRWQAAQQAGLHEIPALVRDLDDRDTLEVALVENIQRQDLSPLEEAEGYQRLLDEFGHTQEALAGVIGKSRSHIANMLRLLGLPREVKDLVDAGQLSAGHARALLTAGDPVTAAREVVGKGLSVRETEKLAKSPPAAGKKDASRRRPEKPADVMALEKRLADEVGLKVEVREKKKGGELVLRYKTLDQLDDLIARLTGE